MEGWQAASSSSEDKKRRIRMEEEKEEKQNNLINKASRRCRTRTVAKIIFLLLSRRGPFRRIPGCFCRNGVDFAPRNRTPLTCCTVT